MNDDPDDENDDWYGDADPRVPDAAAVDHVFGERDMQPYTDAFGRSDPHTTDSYLDTEREMAELRELERRMEQQGTPLWMDLRSRLPPEAIDPTRALVELPPLIKGYLRLGGFVGDGAVIDEQFNTTDICIVVKTDLVTEKYLKHYERKSREG